MNILRTLNLRKRGRRDIVILLWLVLVAFGTIRLVDAQGCGSGHQRCPTGLIQYNSYCYEGCGAPPYYQLCAEYTCGGASDCDESCAYWQMSQWCESPDYCGAFYVCNYC